MDSVECGENSGKTFAGELLGTDSAHKKTQALLCQEYVVESDKMSYRIRPRDEKHPALLPVGEKAQFRMENQGTSCNHHFNCPHRVRTLMRLAWSCGWVRIVRESNSKR